MELGLYNSSGDGGYVFAGHVWKPKVLGWFLANSSFIMNPLAYCLYSNIYVYGINFRFVFIWRRQRRINKSNRKKEGDRSKRKPKKKQRTIRKGKTDTDIDFVAITIWNMQTGNQLANCPKRNTLCIWLFKINPVAQQKLNYIIETNFGLSSWFFHILRSQQICMCVFFFFLFNGFSAFRVHSIGIEESKKDAHKYLLK